MDPIAPFDAEQFEDPIALFHRWFAEAEASEPNDPNAMALATCTPAGIPSVRMVLLKRLDDRGFTFYTNAESRKGEELLANPHAALLFHWKSRRRQIRIEGPITPLPPEDADQYFHSRSRRSQLGAVASQQSRPLASRADLEAAADAVAAQYPEGSGPIPRPDYWRGFLLAPTAIEFWQDGAFRLHDRVVFTHHPAATAPDALPAQSPPTHPWSRQRLYP